MERRRYTDLRTQEQARCTLEVATAGRDDFLLDFSSSGWET